MTVVSFMQNSKLKMETKLELFRKGAGDIGIITMILIFMLSGVFSAIASKGGAVDAIVNLGLDLLPPQCLVAGLFIIACFVSISVGTSVGTIAAVSPIAVVIAQKTNLDIGFVLASVVGGSMFGDNLSMISDTTIAAAKTQGVALKDKFRTNFKIVLPAAIVSIILYTLFQSDIHIDDSTSYTYSLLDISPYVIVLTTALLGINVIYVLGLGIISATILTLWKGLLDLNGILQSVATGMNSMAELSIICILIAGSVSLMKQNGGVEFVLDFAKKRIKNKKNAEIGIGFLTGFVNLCTANNTIAIIISGPIVKEISQQFQVPPKRAASLMDIFSCFIQGAIPYGAQILTAVSFGGASLTSGPYGIIQYLFYPYLMILSTFIYITFIDKKEKSVIPNAEISKIS